MKLKKEPTMTEVSEKRGRGRPPIRESRKIEASFYIRAATLSALQEYSKKLGITRSEFARRAVLNYLSRLESTPEIYASDVRNTNLKRLEKLAQEIKELSKELENEELGLMANKIFDGSFGSGSKNRRTKQPESQIQNQHPK